MARLTASVVFPDTAFAGTDGDDGSHTGQRLRGWRLLLLSGTRGKCRTHGLDYT